jgi:hypothetical protein
MAKQWSGMIALWSVWMSFFGKCFSNNVPGWHNWQVAAMRKRLKKKLRSCALCKPHKMGWDNRRKPREESLLREAEQEIAITSVVSYKEPHDT